MRSYFLSDRFSMWASGSHGFAVDAVVNFLVDEVFLLFQHND